MGGFRTPARAKPRGRCWPASGNLHHSGRSVDRRRLSI